MSSYPIAKIEGIGPVFTAKLAAVGITTTRGLLDRARDPKARAALAEESGIEVGRILKWANMADLMRIKGISEEISDLLEAAGVDTVPELKRRRADHLAAALQAINARKNLVRRVPGEAQCSRFIEEARALPRVLSY